MEKANSRGSIKITEPERKIEIATNEHNPTSQNLFEKLTFSQIGENVYDTSCCFQHTYIRCFQYEFMSSAFSEQIFKNKTRHYVLSVEKKVKLDSIVIFICPNMRDLWKHLKLCLAVDLELPSHQFRLLFLIFSGKVIRDTFYFITLFFFFSIFTFVVLERKGF